MNFYRIVIRGKKTPFDRVKDESWLGFSATRYVEAEDETAAREKVADKVLSELNELPKVEEESKAEGIGLHIDEMVLVKDPSAIPDHQPGLVFFNAQYENVK